MRLIFRFIVYAILIGALATGCIMFFKDHPEVQLAFLVPGIFFLIFSRIRDDIYAKDDLHYRG